MTLGSRQPALPIVPLQSTGGSNLRLNIGELWLAVSGVSAEQHMIRTAWLGLFLLLSIAALASFKFAFSPQQPVSLSRAAALVSADAEASSMGRAVAPDTLTKGDRLQIVYVAPSIDVKPAATAGAPAPPRIRPPTTAPRIISRHWHDPNDRKVAQGAKQKTRARDSTKSAPVVDRKPAVEANSCKPDGLQGLRQLFNMAGNCAKTN